MILSSSDIWVGSCTKSLQLVWNVKFDISNLYLMMFHLAHVQPKPKSKSPMIQWSETAASSKVWDIGSVGFAAGIKLCSGIHCIAQSGDKCKIGSWVFICLPEVRGYSSLYLAVKFIEKSTEQFDSWLYSGSKNCPHVWLFHAVWFMTQW